MVIRKGRRGGRAEQLLLSVMASHYSESLKTEAKGLGMHVLVDNAQLGYRVNQAGDQDSSLLKHLSMCRKKAVWPGTLQSEWLWKCP